MPLQDIIPVNAPPLVDAPTLSSWLGVCHQTIHKWAAAGVLPRPIRMGVRKLMWDTAAVRAVIRRKFEEAESVTPISTVGVPCREGGEHAPVEPAAALAVASLGEPASRTEEKKEELLQIFEFL